MVHMIVKNNRVLRSKKIIKVRLIERSVEVDGIKRGSTVGGKHFFATVLLILMNYSIL